MTEYVTIKMTKKEARALLEAAGNTCDHEDALVAVFCGDKQEMRSCMSGYEKLRQAHR